MMVRTFMLPSILPSSPPRLSSQHSYSRALGGRHPRPPAAPRGQPAVWSRGGGASRGRAAQSSAPTGRVYTRERRGGDGPMAATRDTRREGRLREPRPRPQRPAPPGPPPTHSSQGRRPAPPARRRPPGAGLETIALAGVLIFLLGGFWDVAWHVEIGRDTFWSPPHLLLYLGVLV